MVLPENGVITAHFHPNAAKKSHLHHRNTPSHAQTAPSPLQGLGNSSFSLPSAERVKYPG